MNLNKRRLNKNELNEMESNAKSYSLLSNLFEQMLQVAGDIQVDETKICSIYWKLIKLFNKLVDNVIENDNQEMFKGLMSFYFEKIIINYDSIENDSQKTILQNTLDNICVFCGRSWLKCELVLPRCCVDGECDDVCAKALYINPHHHGYDQFLIKATISNSTNIIKYLIKNGGYSRYSLKDT